jgi:UDP-glucose 4-epimerase
MILVTGGLGYIGSHTVVELLNSGYEVVVIDNLSNSKIDIKEKIESITGKKFQYYLSDIRNTEDLDFIFNQHEIDSVIHFAALKSVNESIERSVDYYENNISGLINVLKCCEKYDVDNFIFSSSCTIYGQPLVKVVTEETPIVKPTTPYGNSKKMGEEIINDYVKSTGGKSVLLRYFNPVGSHSSGLLGDDPNGVPNNLLPYLTRVASGDLEQLSVFGNDYDTIDGSCVRDYIHVVDLAISHVKSIEYLNKSERSVSVPFNIGTGVGTSVLQLIESFEQETGKEVKYKVVGRREGDIEWLGINT